MFQIVTHDSNNGRLHCATTATNERELRQDGAHFWHHLLENIVTHRKTEWNRIYFESWDEYGHIIAYPFMMGDSPTLRQPEAIYKVQWADELIRKLDDIEDDNEDDERSLFALIGIRLYESIGRCYRKEPAISTLKNVRKSVDFTAWSVPNGDREKMSKIEIFY